MPSAETTALPPAASPLTLEHKGNNNFNINIYRIFYILSDVTKFPCCNNNPRIEQKYVVFQCGDIEKMMKKRKSVGESPVYYVTMDTYDIIKKAHIATRHGGRDRMNLGAKYADITKEALELSKSYRSTCQEKRKRNKTAGIVVKPLLSSEFNSHGQVDLVDMQSLPQAQFK
ncbi:uncharacterized protein LOC119589598 [Penaeus monodon]|uniref:uncharacterized protein LOC119589598 n=1 Tax=Penaeus monodon TaxID=6687 RepID=UPI0018A76842|nr:uncharacterized protein LOC119589598 [Penaeus monodon]